MNRLDESELNLFGFCITFSEYTKITSIYFVNKFFELSQHVIICLTHSHITNREKESMENFKYIFKWTCQVKYGKDVTEFTILSYRE